VGSILRSVLAVVLGLFVGFVFIMAIQMLSMVVNPPPPGLDFNNPEAMKQYIATLPTGAFVLVLASYAVGTFAGAFVTVWVARRAPLVHGLILGGLFLLAAIQNMRTLPHPVWFQIVALALFLPVAWLGASCAPSRRPPQQQPVPVGVAE
jgi:hypothetical protein